MPIDQVFEAIAKKKNVESDIRVYRLHKNMFFLEMPEVIRMIRSIFKSTFFLNFFVLLSHLRKTFKRAAILKPLY